MKQIPTDRPLAGKSHPGGYDHETGEGPPLLETNVMYLNAHAEEWKPPMGDLHLHLMYAGRVHWRTASKGSQVCKIPGRCYKVTIHERMPDMLCNLVRRTKDD